MTPEATEREINEFLRRAIAPALEGAPEEVADAIATRVTDTMVADFVACLSDEPMPAKRLRGLLRPCSWFPSDLTPDTQLRYMRVVRDACVQAGHPVCSTNHGYFLGSAADLRLAAERAERQADGCLKRAQALRALADEIDVAV